MLFTIGAGDQVVGVSDFCQYPVEAKTRPRAGGLINPSLERVLALKPDVVLLYRSQGDFSAKLASLGVRSELSQVDTITDIERVMVLLGGITGRSAAAAELNAKLRDRLADVQRQSADLPTSVSGVIIVSRDPAELRSMYQAASGNFLGELFLLAGGKLAISEGSPVSREDIIRANPQVIIDMTQAPADGNTTTPVKARDVPYPWNTLTTVDAVRSGNVYALKDSHAMLPGPSVMDTAAQLSKLLKEVLGATGRSAD